MASSSASTSTLGLGAGDAASAFEGADDPNDWKDDYAFLKALDSSLRCEVCYDIFTAPVSLKECGHTFCSACVRSSINQPDPYGHHCPKCMAKNVYDSQLVPQQGMESVALQWRIARKKLFKKQRDDKKREEAFKAMEEKAAEATPSRASLKRPRSPERSHDEAGPSSRQSSSPPTNRAENGRMTRSRTRGASPKETAASQVIVFETDSEEDDSYDPRATRVQRDKGSPSNGKAHSPTSPKDYREMTANDLSPCPICQHTFTIAALNRHLDKGSCSPDDPQPSDKERGLTATETSGSSTLSVNGGGGASAAAAAGGGSWFQKPLGMVGVKATTDGLGKGATTRKRLTRPNYALTKDKDLRSKLEEHRLSTSGTREKLIERHRQWVNLFNANLDASTKVQKPDSALRKELADWERAQDEAAAQKSRHAAVSSSDKRAKAYAAANRDQFRMLSEQAKMSHLKNKEAHGSGSERSEEKAPINKEEMEGKEEETEGGTLTMDVEMADRTAPAPSSQSQIISSSS